MTTAAAETAEKKNPVIYTRTEQAGGIATLWLGKGLEKSPAFSGYINEARVALFKVNGKNGVFFSVSESVPDSETMKRIGRANVRINPVGIPKLVIDLDVGKSIWMDFRKEITESMLIGYGMDVAKRDAQKAAYEVGNISALAHA